MKKMITMAMLVFSMAAFAQQEEVKFEKPIKKEFSGKQKIKKGPRYHKGDKILKELNLTEAQVVKIKEIKGKQRLEFSQLRKKHKEEFQSVLTKDQVQKLEKAKLDRPQKRADQKI